MINVYLQGTTSFDNNGEATLIPLSCSFAVGINNAWSVTLEHPYDKEGRYQHLVKDAILRITGIDFIREWTSTEQMVRIYDVKKSLTSVTVIGFPLGMEAQYDAPIEYINIGEDTGATGVQAAQALDAYVKQHDSNNKYTVTSDITKTCYNVVFENTNLIAAISGENGFVHEEDGWGGEVVYDNYSIKILDKIGEQNNPYSIRYGRNLTGLEHEIDSSSIVTRLYPISNDNLRLNDYTDTTQQSGQTYVDSDEVALNTYPFIRATFIDTPLKLVNTTNISSDTSKHTTDPTAVLTAQLYTTMYNKFYEKAEALWDAICADVTNTRNASYIKSIINGSSGQDGIIQYLQRKFSFKSESWQSLVKSCAKQGLEWIKSEDIPNWEWHENTDVIPHAWWYGDNSVTPAVSYAKNCYVKIGKYWEYFNDDGYWVDYKRLPDDDMEWHEAKDNSGRKWFGYEKGYYAHNEYVYMTVEGQMKEWFYDSDGWYVEDSSGDSDKGWHGSGTDQDPYWFGEEGASADDKSKYIHDRWAFIDGTYYWFDEYGYINADPERSYPDWPWGNQETSEGSLWFGNDSDHGMNATWLANQWAKIDGEWHYFDSDGWAVDMDNVMSSTITWFADEVYNYVIDTVKACLKSAYDFLYNSMTSWCEGLYNQGLDKPTINVSVDLIDLSKTTEYSAYKALEKICLGDKVKVVGRDGSSYEERVVGLTYDCIRGYNTQVEIGQLSKTVSQIVSSSFKGSDNSNKLVAGDNVIIEQRSNGAQIITVADYTGRTIGLQDVTMNGASVVSGNVAGFNIAAGENISISRDGRTLTISAEGGGALKYFVENNKSLYGTQDLSTPRFVCDPDYYFDYKVTEHIGYDQPYCLVVKDNDLPCITCSSDFLTNGADMPFTPTTVGQTFTGAIIFVSTNADATKHTIYDGNGNLIYNAGYYRGNVAVYNSDNYMLYKNYAYEFTFNDATWYASCFVYVRGSDWMSIVHDGNITKNNWISMGEDTFAKCVAKIMDGVNIAVNRTAYSGLSRTTNLAFFAGASNVNGTDAPIKIYGDGTYEGIADDKQDKLTAGANIQIAEDGTISATDTTYSAFVGTDGQTAGAAGLVPAPTTSDANKFLKGDGTWAAGGSGGSSVIANPSGTPTDTLQTVEIDGTIYEIEGGAGGGELVEDDLWTNTTGAGVGTYTLSNSIDDYDFIAIYYGVYSEYTSGILISDYRLVSVKDLNQLHTDGKRLLITGWNNRTVYLDFDQTTMVISVTENGNTVLKVRGIKIGGASGGIESLADFTWTEILSTNGASGALPANYNKLLFMAYYAGTVQVYKVIDVAEMKKAMTETSATKYSLSWSWNDNHGNYDTSYFYFDGTNISIASGYSGVGCKLFGANISASGNNEIINLAAGDGTTSRTFTFSRTPKRIAISWYEGDGASDWATSYTFIWGDHRAYGFGGNVNSSTSGQYPKVASIIYGQDGKSFTVTAPNAGSACNSSGANHHGYLWVEY